MPKSNLDDLGVKAELKIKEFEELARRIIKDASEDEAREFHQCVVSCVNQFMDQKASKAVKSCTHVAP